MAPPESLSLGSLLAAALLLLTALPAVAGDARRGAEIYQRCGACHSLERDRTGPRHCGLIGRRAGSLPGFDYSAAMRDAGLIWSVATLDRFLADPLGTLPGTTMTIDGIKDARERADLLAYLTAASADPETCPEPG